MGLTRRIPRRWPVQAPLLFGAVLLIAGLQGACVSAGGAKPPESSGKPASGARDNDQEKSAAPSPAKQPTSSELGPQPPDGKWLTDERGQQYFVDKLEKAGRQYLRLDDKTVRTSWGIPIEVVREDDEHFYYKVYRVDPNAKAQTSLLPQRTPEEVKKIAASYEAQAPESRRLSFTPFSKGLPTSGQWRNGFDIADMNGDGHPDILHGPPRKSLGPPVIFLGDGKGTWRRWNEVKYARLPFDYGDAAAADFNGDGHMDIALGMHLRGVVAMLGDGKGNFTDWSKGLDLQVAGSNGSDGSGFSSRTIATLDWNGDNRPDIMALGEGPRLNLSGRGNSQTAGVSSPESFGVVVYLNQGNGTWVRKDQGTSSQEIFGDALVLADFNGDRRKDFATGSSVMGRRSLMNYAGEDGTWSPTELEAARPQGYVRSVAAADFNGDGRDDLAVGYLSFELEVWRSGIDILYSGSDGSWTRRPLAMKEGRLEFSALDAGDLDGDGQLDLAALTGKGETWIFRGDGKGFFTREAATGIPPFTGECRGYHIELADLNGDGKDEIVSGFAGEGSPMFSPDLCPSQGGLQAWQAVAAVGR